MVRDMGNSNPTYLAGVNDKLFFKMGDLTYGYELWKSDGTADGTVMVKDIRSGGGSSWPEELTNVNGTLFFTAHSSVNGEELWKSDGTADGTVMVKDVRPGSEHSAPSSLTNVNGILFFMANDGTNGKELWKSDGMADGTVMVRDIRPNGSSWPEKLTNVNGTLFFTASDITNGRELWKSDGTADGTVMVRDIQTGKSTSSPEELANMDGTLFLRANDGLNGAELWRMADIPATPEDFSATAVSQTEITLTWTDTSVGETEFMIERAFSPLGLWTLIAALPENTVSFDDTGLDCGTQYYYRIRSDNAGVNSDNVATNTVTQNCPNTEPSAEPVMVRDILPGEGGSYLGYLTKVNDTLFFTAQNGINGRELWKSNGTPDGTVMVRDIRAGGDDSDPAYFIGINNTLFFTADNGINGYELWKSNGTSDGTVMVRDIWVGESSHAGDLTNMNDTLFFGADDGIHGYELWKSDGTTNGTVMLKDIFPGGNDFTHTYIGNFINVNDMLFFAAYNELDGRCLWKSDGTPEGTVMVENILPNLTESGFYSFTEVNGMLFFAIDNETHGAELWKSDGTSDGTVMIKDILPGSYPSDPCYLTNVNDTLFFAANDDINGEELWKSDGTSDGTVIVRDIRPGSSDSHPEHLININGTLFFSAYHNAYGCELWKSDGSPDGTVMLKDIRPGGGNSSPRNLTNVNGILFFVANDGVNGYELWKSDGTEDGTVFVKDIRPGEGSSSPSEMTNVNGALFFIADDGTNGRELWMLSDMPSAPTELNATAASETQITLSWTDNSDDETGFRVERSPDGETEWAEIATTESGISTYEDAGLTCDTSYYYRVLAYNNGGDSAHTNTVMETTSACPATTTTMPTTTSLTNTTTTLSAASTTTTLPATTSTPNTTTVPTVTTTTLAAVNSPCSNIILSSMSIPENQPASTTVGTFSATDPDSGDTHTYHLVTGPSGSLSNSLFQISGNTLKTRQTFDYETRSSYRIYVRCNDNHGGSCFKTFTISVANVNEAPTGLSLSGLWVYEGSPVGTEVGKISTSGDPDAGDTHTCTLVSGGEGSTDNGLFSVSGNSLRTASVLDYETGESLSIRVRTSDAGGLWIDRQFTVTVSDVSESPVAEDQTFSVDEDSPSSTVIGTVPASDPESDPLTFSIIQGNTDNAFAIDDTGKITVSGGLDYESTSAYALTVEVSDGTNAVTALIAINITDVNEPPAVSDQTFSFSGLTENGISFGTVAADDEDGDALSFAMTEGDTDNVFGMNSSTGEITLADSSQLDYGNTASYPLIVQVSDGTNTVTALVTVEITAAGCDYPTTESVKSGSYGVPSTWSDGVPGSDDVVRINAGHRVYDAPSLITVRGLCNKGTLEGGPGRPLHIRADAETGFIRNQGSILGYSHSPVFDPQYPTPAVAATRGDDGGNGGGIRLDAGADFHNSGTIRAGHGGAGYLRGGNGGSVEVYADTIIHEGGLIAAGDGGEANAHQPEWDGKPNAHDYGNVDVFGGEGGKTVLHAAESLTTKSPGHTSSGEGGNSYVWCSSEDCQLVWGTWQEDGRWWTGRCQCSGGTSVAGSSPGQGGDLIMLAPDLNVLSTAKAGKGLYYEPSSITTGPDTRIEAEDVFIYGGDNWLLNLRNLSAGAISAANDITLAVGENGVIDLRENWQRVFSFGGVLRILTDTLLLEDGVSVEDLADIDTDSGIEIGSAKILFNASLNAPTQVSGQPGVAISIELSLSNAGPESDTYTLSVSDAEGWEIGNLPPSITLGGLGSENLSLEVTPPSAVCEITPLTITAVSQTDPSIVAEITVDVAVSYPQNSDGCYVVAIEGSPFAGEALTIPLSHPAVRPCSQGGGVHIDISEWAEYEGISEAAGYEIHGTDEGDEIYGSVAKDTVYGYGGDDRLEGDDEDVLDGGSGDNTVIRTQDAGDDAAVPGDADGSGTVDIADAILTLQVLTEGPAEGIRTAADVNGDLRIGPEELVHILREISK